MPFCKNCGTEVSVNQDVCVKCGTMVATPKSSVTKRIIAALLAIFLGGIGVHKFYLGKPVMGVVYILFCWTGIPALVGLIEGIIYLCKTDEEFTKEYGN